MKDQLKSTEPFSAQLSSVQLWWQGRCALLAEARRVGQQWAAAAGEGGLAAACLRWSTRDCLAVMREREKARENVLTNT